MSLFYKAMIHLYLIVTMLSIYTPIKEVMLFSLVFLSCYFSGCLFFTLQKNRTGFNKYVFLILIAIFISIPMAGTVSYAIVNILVISGVYYIVSRSGEYVLRLLSRYIIVVSLINALLYYVLPPDSEGMKVVNDVIVSRVELDMLPLSIASIIALMAFILVGQVKNKFIVYGVRVINVLLMLQLGKLSVIFSLVSVYMAVVLVTHLYKFLNTRALGYVLKSIYVAILSFPFVIVYFKHSLNEDFVRLLTSRVDIYESFLLYILGNGSFLFGYGFTSIDNEALLFANPHNQMLGIFFILGLFGLTVYLLMFFKILDNLLRDLRRGEVVHITMFLALTLLMQIDSYFLLTVFPLYTIFFIFYLVKRPASLTSSKITE